MSYSLRSPARHRQLRPRYYAASRNHAEILALMESRRQEILREASYRAEDEQAAAPINEAQRAERQAAVAAVLTELYGPMYKALTNDNP